MAYLVAQKCPSRRILLMTNSARSKQYMHATIGIPKIIETDGIAEIQEKLENPVRQVLGTRGICAILGLFGCRRTPTHLVHEIIKHPTVGPKNQHPVSLTGQTGTGHLTA